MHSSWFKSASDSQFCAAKCCLAGSDFSTEALPGALPVGQNQPQRCPYDLYAEGITGTTFTTPRSLGLGNQRTWLYRIRPTIALSNRFAPYHGNPYLTSDFAPRSGSNNANGPVERPVPNVLQWNPLAIPGDKDSRMDFVNGLRTMAGSGSVQMRDGLAYHVYVANASMERRAFYNADGNMIIFPQVGTLDVRTEMGRFSIVPNEFLVIPRGIRFAVSVEGPSRGFVLEVFNPTGFMLPDLGPIGANHLAHPRDFLAPVAAFVDKDEDWEVVGKYMGNLSQYTMDHCPFDVVAWHGCVEEKGALSFIRNLIATTFPATTTLTSTTWRNSTFSARSPGTTPIPPFSPSSRFLPQFRALQLLMCSQSTLRGGRHLPGLI